MGGGVGLCFKILSVNAGREGDITVICSISTETDPGHDYKLPFAFSLGEDWYFVTLLPRGLGPLYCPWSFRSHLGSRR